MILARPSCRGGIPSRVRLVVSMELVIVLVTATRLLLIRHQLHKQVTDGQITY